MQYTYNNSSAACGMHQMHRTLQFGECILNYRKFVSGAFNVGWRFVLSGVYAFDSTKTKQQPVDANSQKLNLISPQFDFV